MHLTGDLARAVRSVMVACSVIALASCATNPLQGAKLWMLEQCANAATPKLKFPLRDGVESATVDRAACTALQSAAKRIEQQANFAITTVYIADLAAANAFATRNKAGSPVIVVTVGMLLALGGDEAAWAGLVGHEIAHQVRNHSEGRREAEAAAQAGGQAIASILGSLIPGVGGAIAGTVGGTAAQWAMYGSYTRPQEAEADQLGLTWMVRAGYEPSGLLRLFDVLSKQPSLPAFLSTHPGAGDRKQQVEQVIASSRSETNSGFTAPSSSLPASSSTQAAGGVPVAVLTCADATSSIRLRTLCVSASSCQQQAQLIKTHCSKAGNAGCVASVGELSSSCGVSVQVRRDASCVSASERVSRDCSD